MALNGEQHFAFVHSPLLPSACFVVQLTLTLLPCARRQHNARLPLGFGKEASASQLPKQQWG
jgi:hypothetical protein